MPVIADRLRAAQVYGAIVRAQQEGSYPFNLKSTVTPQHEAHLPTGLKDDPGVYAYFLLVLCYFMRGMDSVTAAKSLGVMYTERPELFTKPVSALLLKRPDLGRLIADYGLSFSQEAAECWQDNLRSLLHNWDGDLWMLILGINADYDEAVFRLHSKYDNKNHLVRGFRGFQYKMVSMYLYYLMAEGLIDEFVCPIPVDFHILRLTVANRVIEDPEAELPYDYMSPANHALVRQLTVEAQLDLGIGMVELCNALWLFGKAMCRYNPGNGTHSGAYNARSTYQTPHEVTWSTVQFNNWQRSCAICPVRTLCAYNVPSGPYFRKGRLLALSPRQDPDEAIQAQAIFNPYLFASDVGSRSKSKAKQETIVGKFDDERKLMIEFEFGPDDGLFAKPHNR